jgi:hypothetical protein
LHRRKKRKAAVVEREIRTELISKWGDMLITDVTRDDVMSLIGAIRDRHAPLLCPEHFRHCRGLFSWAIRNSKLASSPYVAFKLSEDIAKKEAAHPDTERPRDCSILARNRKARVSARGIIPNASLTWQRKSEVSDARRATALWPSAVHSWTSAIS